MISSKQVLVTGGQFIQQHYHNSQISVGNKAPIDILTEAVATNALHNSGASFDKPKCHPRTRVKIRQIIMRWILGEEEDGRAGKQFIWLSGAAGCGKSAIAQSTIESCMERGLLLASFFFNRSDPTRNHAGSLFATLAYQLYCAFPRTEVQTEILSTIEKDPLVFKKTFREQFTSLIIQPLRIHFSKDQSALLRIPFLIVIDGLDECTDRAAQKAILSCLAESLRNSSLCIPIFVASRPEHDIKLSFSSKALKDIHTRLSLDLEDENDSNSDIRLYLYDRFAEIKDDFDNRTTGRKLDQDWPGDKVIETLVWKASGQFIYAATVIRYVESTRHRPDHRLDIILDHRPVKGDHPFDELDSLYAMILESVSDIQKVLHVLSLWFMDVDRIHCSIFEKLLSYDEGELETLFYDMGALVRFELDNSVDFPEGHNLYRLRFLHASFREYLLNAARSKRFHIDIDNESMRYAVIVFQYLVSYGSSSFDWWSVVCTPMHISRHIQEHIHSRIDCITISLELRQSLLSFPLNEFLEPHSSSPDRYEQLLEHFVTPFLALLENIVSTDPALSYIRDHQLGTLRPVLSQQIQRYFEDDKLACLLVLFYHVGSHRFVPILENPHTYGDRYSTPFYPVPDFRKDDILSLSHLWKNSSFPFEDNVYHRFVRQWLHDPDRTAGCGLGPTMYGKAALACFKELARTVPLQATHCRKTTLDIHLKPATPHEGEDDTYLPLSVISEDGGQWRYKYCRPSELDEEELYFLLLGYVIFFLPRCGRSDALVAACQDHAWARYIKKPPIDPVPPYNPFLRDDPFPIRRRRFHEEINNYLARVSSNFISESCGI
ncbi:hypothetical protein CPC08DRAFT_716778 [Agrocybe pediades]|nr:hypothetical protein CPC08DRAFT_716778 [Agrocybe pediades]